MKKRVLLMAALCLALLLCGCGTQAALAGAPMGAMGALRGQKAQAPAVNENEPAATPESDPLASMTLEELAAVADDPGIFMSLVMDRMPEVTFDEVKALGVLNDDLLAELYDYWSYITSQMPQSTPEPASASAPLPGITVGLAQGTVSHPSGYAVQGGDTLSTEAGSAMELELGEGNYIQLHQNTQVTLDQAGDRLQVNLSYGHLSFYLGAPEQLTYSISCINSLCSVDMESRCGFISRERGAMWMRIASYLGQMPLHLKDGSGAVAKDGATTTVRGENEVEESAFSGSFYGMETMILNHRELADVLAEAYDMQTADVLLTVGIRTEPEIHIRDLNNGTYDRTVIDVNGDVVEDGRFNSADDSVLSNHIYEYDESHRTIREEWIAPGNYWDGKVTTYTYYDTGEVKTESYTMPDGRFENNEYDLHQNSILMEAGVDGVVETHRETEYNDAGDPIHERTVGKDYIAESFYDDAGRPLQHVRTDLDGNKINVSVYTYYENGEKATERTEDYSINHMWYETAYDEAGNVIRQESGKLE